MSKKKRIPLPSHLATRDSAVSKDGMLQNFYEEDTPIGKMIVKRPGQTNNIALGACVAQGSTFFNNNNYFICSNVLYQNPTPAMPPTCGVPGNVITWGVGFFAAIDPITNFVWVSDSPTSTVKVYNPADQSLKAAIAIPAGAGNPAGLFYIASLRSFVVGGSLPLANPDVWLVGADSYTITNTVDFSGGSGYDPAFPALIPFTNTVVVYNNNVLGGGGNFSFALGTYTGSGADPYPHFANSPAVALDYLPIPNLPLISYYSGNNVWVVNFTSPASFTTYSTAGASSVSKQTYDSVRKRIWYIDVTSKALTYIDLTGGVAGAQVVVATMPQAAVEICYDVQRDVLWSVSTPSGDVLKIRPTDGTVLATFPAVGDGSVSPQNVGTRLFVWNNCFLLQNNNVNPALRLIPIQ